MTSDQERTCDALSLYHGGWAVVKEQNPGSCYWLKTAGDQVDYLVLPDGGVKGYKDQIEQFSASAERVQLAVYGILDDNLSDEIFEKTMEADYPAGSEIV